MLKKVTKGLIVAIFLTTPVMISAENVQIDSQRVQSAQKLVNEMGLRNSYTRTIQLMTDDLIKRIPTLTPVKDKILNFYKKYIGWDAIKDDITKIYAKHFTKDELDDLLKFYQTPTGKKALKEMPNIMIEGRKIGMQKVAKHMDELKAIIKEATQTSKKQ